MTAVPLAVALVLACAAPPHQRDQIRGAPLTFADIEQARSSRDYFALRERVRNAPRDGHAATDIAAALLQYAFNEPAQSNAAISRVLRQQGIPDTLADFIREIALDNHLRLFEYAKGLSAADSLLADTTHLDRETIRDVRNVRRIFQALVSTKPQTVTIRGSSSVPMREGRIPVAVGDSARQYVFDTGANLSTMMRSEANALGLRILPAGIDVGTSSALRVTADLAVAPSLSIGSMTFRNVVFLVLDDAMLTFGDHTIPGIVGFPVINQMREVQLVDGREVFVPADAPRRLQANLALSGLTPLIRVTWQGQPLLCRLDTGANTTDFYEPFFRRFRAFIDSAGTSLSRRVGSAGGITDVPVRKLTKMRLMLGDTVALADSVDVLVRPITRAAADNYLDCNIGTDVLGTFSRLILNFRDMAALLR